MYQDALTFFSIGTGFTLAQREALWQAREDLLGRIVSYKYFPSGSKEKPRHPIFVSFRDLDDM
jgi:DNA ligase-1